VNALRCSASPKLDAQAFCTSCRQPFSGGFLGTRRDGRAVCFSCAREHAIEIVSTDEKRETPDPVLEDGWLRGIFRMITRPHRTFERPDAGRLSVALLFGYFFTAFGFVTTTIWNLTFYGEEFLQLQIDTLAAREIILTPDEVTRLVWMMLPLAAALRLFVGALLFHLGTRLMVGSDVHWRSSARLYALTSGTLVLCAIPTLGPFLGLVTWISASMAYLNTRYNLRTVQGLMALLPCLLIITFIGPTSFLPGS
jgi:hypothetical protein